MPSTIPNVDFPDTVRFAAMLDRLVFIGHSTDVAGGYSVLSGVGSPPNGTPYYGRTRSTPTLAAVATMRPLALVQRSQVETALPGTLNCSGPNESGYGRRARWRGTFLAFCFNSASISVSAALVFAAQLRPRSILDRSGSARVQSWLSGTIATVVSRIRPSLNRSRRSVLPA